jgi:NADPH:quinone reductase-like Zn-dependent oxidoreductase
MLAVITPGDGSLAVAEVADPTPSHGEVLVKVNAAGLNGADRLQRAGFYPAPPGAPADVPGLELAGEVVAAGPDAPADLVGRRVMALVAGGGQAQLAVVHHTHLLEIPDSVDWLAAGGFAETFSTAHDALVSQAGLKSGERLLVTGAAGGVGTAAIQIALLVGAEVVASVRNEALRDQVHQLGASVVAPGDEGEHGQFDVVLELVGAPNLPGNLGMLNAGGRIVVIGVGAGAKTELNLLVVMAKRAQIMGSTLRARSIEQKAAVAAGVRADLLPALADGRIQVPVEASFDLADAEAAYARFEAGAKFGKIVLSL